MLNVEHLGQLLPGVTISCDHPWRISGPAESVVFPFWERPKLERRERENKTTQESYLPQDVRHPDLCSRYGVGYISFVLILDCLSLRFEVIRSDGQ